MDRFKPKGVCPKCGQGGIETFRTIKPIVPQIKIEESTIDNYCSKCGQNLWSKCSSCRGSGKKNGGLIVIDLNRDRYCSVCGRSLPEEDDRCTNCDGTGKVYDAPHASHCPKRFRF